MPGGNQSDVVPIGFDFISHADVVVVPRGFDGGKSLWDIGTGNTGAYSEPFGGSGSTFPGDGSGFDYSDEPLPLIPTPQALWPIAGAIAVLMGRRRRR